MIFASTPTTGSPHHRRGRYLAAGVGWGRVHAPNPILVRIRLDDERARGRGSTIGLRERVDMWLSSIAALDTFGGYRAWDSPDHPRHALTTATTDEVDHARRVLGRLVPHLENRSQP